MKANKTSYIDIRNANVNNLKNLSLKIPKNQLIVITGLSGSGKSSLAFDTIYAEGQRRYVESLSSYARQFMGRISKPDVGLINGLSHAIAIEQHTNTHNPRSTVGTTTEIYEYLKLLFARVGKTFSPVSGIEVKCHQPSDVVDFIIEQQEGIIYILSPIIIPEGRNFKEHLETVLQQGFNRIMISGETRRIEDVLTDCPKKCKSDSYIMIDRLRANADTKSQTSQIADSVQTAFYEGNGTCVVVVDIDGKKKQHQFCSRFEADGITFEQPSPHLFSFNNPYGACKKCNGFGSTIGIDEDLVIPNKTLSVYDGAVACWRGEKMGLWRDNVILNASKSGFPIHKPYIELNEKQKQMLWDGTSHFKGINDFFKDVEEQSYKIQYRVILARYRGKTTCPDCHGTRLRLEATYVKVGGKDITQLVSMPMTELKDFFDNLKLSKTDSVVAERLLTEIRNRISFMIEIGLGYLTLNRAANTLSGGEAQRINLATSLGSSLVGSIYILDEPSIGLHQRDTERLINVLRKLRDIGNTVIVVEHDEEIIRSADQIIDIGPLAGSNGGKLVFQGTIEEMMKKGDSLTAKYLSGEMEVRLPARRRKWRNSIEFVGCRENNLKNINVKIPLNVLTVITGVSGSGKSSLVNNIIFNALKREFDGNSERTGAFAKMQGSLTAIKGVEYIDQNPIGRSTRSNPITYVKAFDDIRQLFAEQKLAKMRGLKAGYFSFNMPGGRCDNCEGEGVLKIEMQFMADLFLTCDVCHGTRYKEETLEIKFKGKNISEILDMTIDEAVDFFRAESNYKNITERIIAKMKTLQDVGLGYLKVGQPSSTLSGGEAQRIKLASFLINGAESKPTLFIFDEPTTGLHFHDVNKLMTAFNALIDRGHSIVVIEHDPDVIKMADWIIDLGPEGGDKGGNIVFEGTPENIIKCASSHTGKCLVNKINTFGK